MKTLLFFMLFAAPFLSVSQTTPNTFVDLKHPELIEGKQLSDSTLNILKSLDEASESRIFWYYERYTYLNRTVPSEHVEAILKYATFLRKKNLTITE